MLLHIIVSVIFSLHILIRCAFISAETYSLIHWCIINIFGVGIAGVPQQEFVNAVFI